MLVTADALCVRVRLARRARPNKIKPMQIFRAQFEHIAAHKQIAAISGLIFNVDPEHAKARVFEATARATRFAK